MSNTATPQSTPYPEPGASQLPPAKGSNGLAIAGFVLGLLAVLGSWIPLISIVSIILGAIGAVLAAVGLAKSKKAGTGEGLAVTGLILGVLAIIIATMINVVFVNAVDDAVDEATNNSVEPPANSDSDEVADDNAPVEDAGTTRDNPVPLGSAITGGGWTVTINSVRPTDSDSLGQEAAPGSTLLVVNMTATYNGDEAQGETPWASIKFVTADGATIDSTDGSTLFVADAPFDSLKTLYKDGSVTGDEIIEVPAEGWKRGVLAVSPSIFGDDTFVSVR